MALIIRKTLWEREIFTGVGCGDGGCPFDDRAPSDDDGDSDDDSDDD